MAVDLQPSAAVDPRTPGSQRRYQPESMPIVELPRRSVDLLERKRFGRIVVKSQIGIGVLAGGTPGSGSAEHNRLDAADKPHSIGHALA